MDGVKVEVPGFPGHKPFQVGGHPLVTDCGVSLDHLSGVLRAMLARSRFLP